jgi:hypothetical protein
VSLNGQQSDRKITSEKAQMLRKFTMLVKKGSKTGNITGF